ncbi:MAG: DUF4398 domain-containing protein [Sideroxyarcus sp.]|nr:DUF4398 domain-containing protein [Sideroxyarcus sp.]
MMKKFNQPGSKQIMLRIGTVVSVAAFLAACASPQPPIEQMAASRAAVSSASSTGANEFAPIQIKTAMEKMDGAERAMVKKDYVLARQLAEQAQVDAQLAGAMASTAKAKKAADALQEDSRALRQEIDRNTR